MLYNLYTQSNCQQMHPPSIAFEEKASLKFKDDHHHFPPDSRDLLDDRRLSPVPSLQRGKRHGCRTSSHSTLGKPRKPVRIEAIVFSRGGIVFPLVEYLMQSLRNKRGKVCNCTQKNPERNAKIKKILARTA